LEPAGAIRRVFSIRQSPKEAQRPDGGGLSCFARKGELRRMGSLILRPLKT
jgi:hypothetical protein